MTTLSKIATALRTTEANALIASVDVEPSPELVEWATERQRAAAVSIEAKGVKPEFAVYA